MNSWTSKDALAHHGILGQKWGKRNGPPYPLSDSAHSAAEKKAASTDKNKKLAKIGAIAVASVLASYGGYKLSTSSFMRSMVLSGMNTVSKRQSIEDALANSGPVIVKKMPKNLGGLTNPKGLKDNCKEVSEATIKRWLGVDSGAVAGEKTVSGNLHDFVEKRGYNKAGVKWLGDNGAITPNQSGDSTGRVTRQILEHFEDGDCGMIGVDWDPKLLAPGTKETGHAFNWYIDKGKVVFTDDQPDPPLTNAIDHLSKVNPKIQIEVLKLTKEAFTK